MRFSVLLAIIALLAAPAGCVTKRPPSSAADTRADGAHDDTRRNRAPAPPIPPREPVPVLQQR